jgi:CubicO group peptidase (beta-lactamase class C family)
MHDTRITLNADMKARLAAGHDGSGASVANWDFSVLAGCGALRSTADDLLHFLAANLDSVDTPISADLRETHRPRHPINKSLSIGLAWHMLHVPHADIVMHNGGTGGYRSFIGYDPAMRVGVVVLSNMATDMDDLALHLLNPALPLKSVAKHAEVKLAPGRLEGLVGTYALAPTFVLSVTREGDGLFVQATGQGKLPIYAESDTTFFYRAVDAQLSFERDATGKGTKLTLHQNGREMPGVRIE